jgi:hypothetical protein
MYAIGTRGSNVLRPTRGQRNVRRSVRFAQVRLRIKRTPCDTVFAPRRAESQARRPWALGPRRSFAGQGLSSFPGLRLEARALSKARAHWGPSHAAALHRHRHPTGRPPRLLRLSPRHQPEHRSAGCTRGPLRALLRLGRALPAEPNGAVLGSLRHPQWGGWARRDGGRSVHRWTEPRLLLHARQDRLACAAEEGRAVHGDDLVVSRTP